MDPDTVTNVVKNWSKESAFRDSDKIAWYHFKSPARAAEAQQALAKAGRIEAGKESGKFDVRGAMLYGGTELVLRVASLDPQGVVMKTLGRPDFIAQLRGKSVVIG